MNIVALQAENVKAIKAVRIEPKGNLVEIAGKNGQGKSSILDAIWWALAGTRHIQSVPIRTGETKARIRLDLGELIVERRFSESGTSLAVENAEGARYSSPQKMLDDLLGALSFDPLAFVGEKPANQFETLRETLGLDFSEIDAEIGTTFERRAEANANGKELRAAIGKMEIVGEVPAEPIDTDDLAARIGKAADHNADVERRRANRKNAEDACEDKMARVANLRAEADRLEAEVRETRRQIDAAGALPLSIDVDDLREELATATQRNEAFKAWQLQQKMVDEADGHEARSKDLTTKLEALRQSKADMIAAADMPVEGLGFGDGIVTLDDVPFDQASTAQQLRASVVLAMAANPKLKVIRIKQGAFLDDDNLALIAEMAEERDYQIWIERVDSSGKVGIVIQDGEVVAVNERAA